MQSEAAVTNKNKINDIIISLIDNGW